MEPITITQGGVTATLRDVFFSPASSHIEGGVVYAIEASISAVANMVLADGEAELSYDDQNYTVTVTVLEFDEEEDDVDDVDDLESEKSACHIMIDSGTISLEKLADLLDLEA